MGLVLVAIPIVYFHQTTDFVSGYLSQKGSAKFYLLNPENYNIVRRGLGGRLGVGDFYFVMAHVGDAHSPPSEVVFFLRFIDQCQRTNLAQELYQPCGSVYNF